MTAISTRWLPALTAVLASAFGDAGGLAGQGSTLCLSAAEVTQTVGFTVRVLAEGTRSYGPAEMCAYQAADLPGVTVSLSVQPVDPSEDPSEGPIAEVRSAAKTFLGAQAEADRIDVGDGGYAYGSKSKSEAAARKGDRVFHADIGAMDGKLGDKKAAVIALLQRVVE